MRRLAPDPQGSRLLPYSGHEQAWTGTLGETFLKASKNLLLVHVSYLGVNQQCKASLSVIIFFFFYKLIVSRPSPKLRWKGVLKQLEQICAKVTHALTGKLLKAPDGVKMLGRAGLFERTPAIPSQHGCVVPVFHVEKQSRSRSM